MQNGIRRAWATTAHTVVGFPVAVITGSIVLCVGAYALLAWGHAPGRAQANGLFAASRLCSAIQRSRFAALLEVELELAPAGSRRAAWRGVWYHLIVGFLISVLGFSLIVSLWSAVGAAVLLPIFSRPGAKLVGVVLSDPAPWAALAILAGGLTFAAVKLAEGLARLEVRVARAMLQLTRAEELALRVQDLTESRADVVDAADAERRRIERDLHDGAQQRLVALAMNLGMARANLTDVDPRARDAIEHAHDEAKQALTELRQLVRGLHPAVLDDRGLDAALSGIAARSPVKARLMVDVPVRPSPTVEAVAYFVVSEALTNVAKHARAQSVDIDVRRRGNRLLLEVRDDGQGGADPLAGTGLRGLAQRIRSVDGTWSIDSPPGGPTVIRVELPCES
jgi:signal transduction histidine kinase